MTRSREEDNSFLQNCTPPNNYTRHTKVLTTLLYQSCAFVVFVSHRWFNFEKIVEALVQKGTYHMDFDQLLNVTREVCQIDDKEELTAMLNFYHDLGVIVKHGHTVVLQAQWLIDLFKKLITVRPFDEMVSKV